MQLGTIGFIERVVVAMALVLSSCLAAAPKVEAPKKEAKSSRATERYKKTVEDQLGPLWYRLVKANEQFLNVGTVKILFAIPVAGGKACNLRVASNTGGWMDERIARIAISQLRAPPVPPEIAAQLTNGYFFFDESFTIYDADSTPSPTPSTKVKGR